MEEQDDNIYNCDDKDLDAMMQRLFDEGNESVEIMHPTEGRKVVTKGEFETLKNALGKKPSPANKIKLRKRVEHIAKQKQIRHRTAMITAEVHVIDAEDGKFGCDASGNKLDVDDMIFTPTEHYLPGIEKIDGEVGCFIDEHGKKPPVRVKTIT